MQAESDKAAEKTARRYHSPRRAQAATETRAAILAAPGFGGGHGPLDHGVTVDPGRFG